MDDLSAELKNDKLNDSELSADEITKAPDVDQDGLKSRTGFLDDTLALWHSEPPEKKPALFKTDDEYAYPVYPCIVTVK